MSEGIPCCKNGGVTLNFERVLPILRATFAQGRVDRIYTHFFEVELLGGFLDEPREGSIKLSSALAFRRATREFQLFHCLPFHMRTQRD